MIEIGYSKKGTPYVWASALHQELNIGIPLSMWFPRMIDYGFVENQDFSSHHNFVMTANNMKKQKFDWAVHIDMAKHIAMIQRTERGKALRQYLLNLDNKVQEGKLLDHQQLSVLFDLCRVFGFFSVQEYLELEHYAGFDDKHENWWKYRARILGNPTADLKEMMKAIGKKYQNQRQALFHIDKYELIKRATFDLFKAMGKSDDFAKNVGVFAKQIATELKPEIYDDRNMSIDFKTDKQKETINRIHNRNEVNGLLEKF